MGTASAGLAAGPAGCAGAPPPFETLVHRSSRLAGPRACPPSLALALHAAPPTRRYLRNMKSPTHLYRLYRGKYHLYRGKYRMYSMKCHLHPPVPQEHEVAHAARPIGAAVAKLRHGPHVGGVQGAIPAKALQGAGAGHLGSSRGAHHSQQQFLYTCSKTAHNTRAEMRQTLGERRVQARAGHGDWKLGGTHSACAQEAAHPLHDGQVAASVRLSSRHGRDVGHLDAGAQALDRAGGAARGAALGGGAALAAHAARRRGDERVLGAE
jgi:hypothetical protein